MQGARELLHDLKDLTSDSSAGKESELLQRVTDLFFATADSQNEADSDIFGCVMERIAYEVEVETRAELARRLAPAENAPRGLVRNLAEDDIAVAQPILVQSPRLTDQDLVRIAASQGQDHLHAIASRPTLSPKVTDAIVARGDDRVLAHVAGNEGARFSSNGLEQLSERAKSSDALASALSGRDDIPNNLIDDVKRAAAARVKEKMRAASQGLAAAQIDALVEAEASKADVKRFQASNAALLKLHQAGKIREYLLVYFARERMLPETVRCMALLTGLDDAIVSRTLLKSELAALGLICKASGFHNKTYAALLQIRTTTDRIDGRAIAEAMREYDSLTRKEAEGAIAHVKEHAGTAALEP